MITTKKINKRDILMHGIVDLKEMVQLYIDYGDIIISYLELNVRFIRVSKKKKKKM